MKTTSFVVAGAVAVIGLTGGCSSSGQTPVYNSSETGRILREECGEIVVVKEGSEPPLSVGERVKVLTGDSSSGRMGMLGALMRGGSGGSVRVVREEYIAASFPLAGDGSK